MKKFLTIIFFELFIMSFLFSQNTGSSYTSENFGSKLISEYYSGHNSIDFHAGYISNNFEELNSDFESIYGSRIDNSIACIGISLKGELDIDAFFTCDANLSVEYYLPAECIFSDSLSYTLSGYQVGSVWSKDVFSRAEHFDFLAGIGFSFGRISLVREDISFFCQSGKYSNPFFSPKAALEPRILFGPLSLAFRCEYLFDISKHGWHQKYAVLPVIGKASATGFSEYIVLGVRL